MDYCVVDRNSKYMRSSFTQCVLMTFFGKSVALLDLFGLGVLLKRVTLSVVLNVRYDYHFSFL